MHIFLSWSGQRSKAVAAALRSWLPLVLPAVEPWMSEEDIQAGRRWGAEIAAALDRSSFGIIVLTAENLDASWLMFEAGAVPTHLPGERIGSPG